jgi:hypothetical protein
MKATTLNGKLFHFMAAVEIAFVALDDKQQPKGDPSIARVNCRITNKVDQLGVQQLAHVQQAAQMALKQKLGDEAFASMSVIDVVIINIITLGFMTEDEFQARPTAASGKKTALQIVKENMAKAPETVQ